MRMIAARCSWLLLALFGQGFAADTPAAPLPKLEVFFEKHVSEEAQQDQYGFGNCVIIVYAIFKNTGDRPITLLRGDDRVLASFLGSGERKTTKVAKVFYPQTTLTGEENVLSREALLPV